MILLDSLTLEAPMMVASQPVENKLKYKSPKHEALAKKKKSQSSYERRVTGCNKWQ